MEFIANRLELLELSKKVMRLANEASPIEALKGVYLESNEDSGEVSMITTNYEAAIFMKEKATVLRSGKLVINAKMLTGMLTLLSGDQVEFSATGNNTVKVSSGTCVYNIACLSGEHYPKPVMPFPDEAVKLSGICSLAKKTVFATAKDNSKPALQCVCLKVRQNSAHAAACDGVRMMLVKGDAESSGEKEFLLPAGSFQILASISTDNDTFDVGLVGNEAVFTKNNMLFSIKQHSGSYIDTNQIIQSIKPMYTAITNAGHLRQALDLVLVGAGTMPVNLLFANDAICLKCDGDTGMSSSQTQANITGTMPEKGFLYNPAYLLKLFQVLDGTVKLDIDGKGMMLIRAKNEIYFQLPIIRAHSKKEKETPKTEKETVKKDAA